MKQFRDRTAVVTGGASGIGFAIARQFGTSGANVVIVDIEQAALDQAAAQLRKEGVRVMAQRVDVRDERAVQHLAGAVVEEFGGVHILVNNAGVDSGGWFSDITPEAWDWVMDVNFRGVLNGCRAFLPLLSMQDEAHIVNTASVAAFATGAPTMTPYCVSKFAVLAMTECLEIELRAAGSSVGVSVLVPGPTRTRMTDSERNRPADIGVVTNDVRVTLQARASQFIEREGMEPEETARLVLDAIRDRTFFILTHPALALEGLRTRMAWMVDGIAPAARKL